MLHIAKLLGSSLIGSSLKKTCSLPLLGVVLIGISACGFRLAGDYDLSKYYSQIALKTEAKYRDFNEPFMQRLERAGIEVVDEGTPNVPRLNIKNFSLETNPVNADSRGIAESYDIKGYVRYELTFAGQQTENYRAEDGEDVTRSRSRGLTASRYIDVNSEDQLEGSREAQRLEEELIEELSGNLLRVLVFKRDKVGAYQ